MLRRAALQSLRLAQRSQPATEAPCQLCWSQQIQSQLNKCLCLSQSRLHRRLFSAEAESDDEEDERRVASPAVKKLAEDIMALNLLEVADLTDILQKRLNIQMPAFGGGMAMAAMPGAAPQAGAAAAAPPPVEKEVEKTEFDLKLDSFDATSKIKVIKEVRGMTDLGLKEAKELVEKAPTVLKTGLKKEEAEELKKKLEAAGAKIVLE